MKVTDPLWREDWKRGLGAWRKDLQALLTGTGWAEDALPVVYLDHGIQKPIKVDEVMEDTIADLLALAKLKPTMVVIDQKTLEEYGLRWRNSKATQVLAQVGRAFGYNVYLKVDKTTRLKEVQFQPM